MALAAAHGVQQLLHGREEELGAVLQERATLAAQVRRGNGRGLMHI